MFYKNMTRSFFHFIYSKFLIKKNFIKYTYLPYFQFLNSLIFLYVNPFQKKNQLKTTNAYPFKDYKSNLIIKSKSKKQINPEVTFIEKKKLNSNVQLAKQVLIIFCEAEHKMGTCQNEILHSNYKDTVMGTVQVISHNNVKFIKLIVSLSDRNIYEDWEKSVLAIDSNKTISKFFVMPVNRSYNQCNFFCTGLGEAVLLYHVFKETLQERCQGLKASQKYMTEKDILYLAYMLAKVCKYLSKNNQEVGDLTLNNIVYNQLNQPQLICKISFPNYQIASGNTLIKISDFHSETDNEITPEILQKQNLFKIGMICLCCASQQNIEEKLSKNNFQQIKQKIKQLNAIYSSKICDLLTTLLYDIFFRTVTIKQINDYLQRYQSYILAKEKNINNSSFFNMSSEKSPRAPNLSLLNASEISNTSRKKIFHQIGNGNKDRNYQIIGLR